MRRNQLRAELQRTHMKCVSQTCSCRKFTGVPHILAQREELVLGEEDQMAWKSPSKHKRSNSTI